MACYAYDRVKPELFTMAGMRVVLAVQDALHELFQASPLVRLDAVLREANAGDDWKVLATIDLFIELGRLREIKQATPPPGQHRIVEQCC